MPPPLDLLKSEHNSRFKGTRLLYRNINMPKQLLHHRQRAQLRRRHHKTTLLSRLFRGISMNLLQTNVRQEPVRLLHDKGGVANGISARARRPPHRKRPSKCLRQLYPARPLVQRRRCHRISRSDWVNRVYGCRCYSAVWAEKRTIAKRVKGLNVVFKRPENGKAGKKFVTRDPRACRTAFAK